MNDIIKNMRIRLEKAHVKGIPAYIKKLQDNSNSPNFKDVLLEGEAALMFAGAGCIVTIRKREEPPDLSLKFNNEQFYAEVKHFRLKEQDEIDNAKMRDPNCCVDEFGPYLVQIDDTVPLEGKSAWAQVYGVAIKKTKQYVEHASNILVIESNSSSIDDVIMGTAISMINEDVRFGKCPGSAKLNGILLTLDWCNISQQWRNVFFYRTSNPAVSLGREVSNLLDKICFG